MRIRDLLEFDRYVVAVVAISSAMAFMPVANATLRAQLDQFVIVRNGVVWANDTFSDGLPPPSGGGNFGTSTTPLTYFTQGSFAESGGKAIMDSEATGLPVFLNVVNAATGATILSSNDLTRIHTARLVTSTLQEPANTGGLKRDHHTFDVLALYDLASLPANRSDNFGIGLVDNFAGSGPTRDRLRLSVVRAAATDALRINFWRNDGTTDPDQNLNFGSHALQTNHQQILLRLSRPDVTNNTIVASYAYVDGPNVGMNIANATNLAALSFNTIANVSPEPNTIFNDFIHTRAEFRQLARDVDNRFDFVRLTTGSPVSISQEVFTGPEPSRLGFNYRFETADGVLTVALGGTVLGVISAPASVSTDFSGTSFLVGAGLLNQSLTLTLTLDGPTGSKVLLDSIAFAGIVNGSFSTGDLTGWTLASTGSGGAGVLTILAVPEPSTYVLLLSGLGLVGLIRNRQRRFALG